MGTNLTDYYYHFTDAESALSMLCDGVIRPFAIRPNKSNLKFFGRKKFVLFLTLNPTCPDIDIMNVILNDYDDAINRNDSNYHNLEYAFGFRKDMLTAEIKKMPDESVIWRHKKFIKGEIKLSKDFILFKKNVCYNFDDYYF